MKYAICNELYVDWPIGKVCEHARENGYSGLEIAPFTLSAHASAVSAEQRKEVREVAARSGIEIVGLHWLLAKTSGLHLTSGDPETQVRTVEYFDQLTGLCADIGGKIMVLGSPQQRNFPNSMSYQEAEDNALEVLRNVVPALESRGILLALEPLGPEEGNFLPTAESAVRLIERVDSPNVRLHLDVKAMSTEKKSYQEIIRASQKWLVHFHANDPNRLGPGMGEVDFRPIMETLAEIRYQGWTSVEVFDYSPGVDRIVGESIRYMRAIEDELGATI